MKNDWSTFTRLNDNDVVDGWLKIGNEVYIDYCKTKDLKELTQKVLNAAGYTRWIYIIVHDEGDNDGHIGGRLHVKIGECTTDFLNRYGNITGNTYNHRVIEVFPSNVSDKDIHPNLKKNPIKGVRSDEFTRYANGSEEIYEVTNVESLTNLISETHRHAEKTVECVERKEMRLYNDTSDLGDKIVLQCKDFYDKTNGGSPHIICNLCCRFGKTSFALATWLKTNARILMLTSYIGTVTDSYKSIVLKKKGYERVLVVDTTTEEGLVRSLPTDKFLDAAGKWLEKNLPSDMKDLTFKDIGQEEEDSDSTILGTIDKTPVNDGVSAMMSILIPVRREDMVEFKSRLMSFIEDAYVYGYDLTSIDRYEHQKREDVVVLSVQFESRFSNDRFGMADMLNNLDSSTILNFK